MGLLLRLLLLVGIVALTTALPDVFIETFPLEILLYNQKTTNISTFDGLTYPYYFANDDGLMTLYQSNQWTISLGKENSLMDFKSFTQPQKSVVGLERNMEESRFDMCGSWLISIEHVPEQNMYVAFYHGENRCDLGDTFLCSYSSGTESLKQMGLAYSTDGKSWVKPESNAIISSVNGRAGDGAYFKVSVFPNYRFMLYVQDGSTCIARAAYACISEPSCWKKYYQGAWSSEGIDGACDTIGAPPTVFQYNTQKYVVEFAHYDGNYLMAVEISQYGGTHVYITKSTNPEGPWEPYGSPILYQGAFKNPARITSATVIAEGYLGDNQVIPQGHEISIMYTLSTSNKGDLDSQRESLLIRQPVKIWGPSTWLGVSVNPIRTYILSVNDVPFSWTTNVVYSPIADIVDDYHLGYVATQPVSGATNMGLLYSCLIPIGPSSDPSQTTMITDINFLYGQINPLTPSPECPNAGWTSQYIGYVFWSKPSKYTTQQIDKCMMTGSYTMQFSFLAAHSTTSPCYGMGTPVASFWVFVNSNGY